MVYYFKYNLQNTDLLSVYSVTVMIGNIIGILTMKPCTNVLEMPAPARSAV